MAVAELSAASAPSKAPSASSPASVAEAPGVVANGRSAGTDAVDEGGARRRLTYYMLWRVVVATLLFGVALVGNFVDPTGLPWGQFIFGLLTMSYVITVLFALLLRRGTPVRRLSAYQVACDAATATLLVHAGGGAESGFLFIYLMVIVGAAMILPRAGTVFTTAGIGLAYLFVSVADRTGLLPPVSPDLDVSGPLAPLLFPIAKNLVFFVATAALSRRLGAELERAGERIAAQGARLDDLVTLYADVVRSLPSGLLTLADDGVVRSVNPAGEEILGVAPGALVGRRLVAELPELGPSLAALDRGAPRRSETEITRSDGGRRFLGLSLAPLFDAGGVALGQVMNFQDLTQLRRMQEQIERSDRLAAIGRLAAGVAHEIRNPLAAISGSVQLLGSTLRDDDQENRDLMQTVLREVERLDALLTDLLEYASPRRAEKTVLELGAAIAEIVRVSENDRRLSQPGRLIFAARQPLLVEMDPNQLRQVILNLLLNAADATPGGEPIELSLSDENGQAKVELRDHGPGIPPAIRARVFEPFFTTKHGGTGLGLALVHRIVDEHQGRIDVRDAPDGGAVFTLRFPLRPAQAAASDERAPAGG